MDNDFSPIRILEAERGFGSLKSPVLVSRHINRFRPLYEEAAKRALERAHESDVWLVHALETAERINGRVLLEWMNGPAGMPAGTPVSLIEKRDKLLEGLRYLDAGGDSHAGEDAESLSAALEMLAQVEQAIWSSPGAGDGTLVPPSSSPNPSDGQDLAQDDVTDADSLPGGRDLLLQIPADTCLFEYFAIAGRVHVFVAEYGRVTAAYGLDIGVSEVRDAILSASLGIRLRQNAATYRTLEDKFGITLPTWDLESLPYLHEHLVAPLAHHLQEKVRLWVVLDDSMADLPFETLFRKITDESGPMPHFLAEDVAITRLPSLAVLHRITQAPVAPWKPYVTNVPVQAGGPAGSHMEAAAVGALLHTPVASGDLGDLLACLPDASWLHVSSHADVSAHLTHLQALALANGYLTPSSLPPLQLSMAVLSACSTSEGDCLPQAPWAGLCGAFLVRGTHAVVASGWPVSVEATCRLMDAFYLALHTGAPADRALQTAQLAVMRQYSAHPYYWAAFRLIGDGTCHLPTAIVSSEHHEHAI